MCVIEFAVQTRLHLCFLEFYIRSNKIWKYMEKSGGCTIYHGHASVINVYKAGKNLSVYQGVTLGNKGTGSRSVTNPTIGDNVSICANATVIGGVKIGNNVIIGAGSVVTKDIPDNYIAYGNPMILKKRQ